MHFYSRRNPHDVSSLDIHFAAVDDVRRVTDAQLIQVRIVLNSLGIDKVSIPILGVVIPQKGNHGRDHLNWKDLEEDCAAIVVDHGNDPEVIDRREVNESSVQFTVRIDSSILVAPKGRLIVDHPVKIRDDHIDTFLDHMGRSQERVCEILFELFLTEDAVSRVKLVDLRHKNVRKRVEQIESHLLGV